MPPHCAAKLNVAGKMVAAQQTIARFRDLQDRIVNVRRSKDGGKFKDAKPWKWGQTRKIEGKEIKRR